MITIYTLLLQKAYAESTIQDECFRNAKMVLFLKAQTALTEKFKEDVYQKSLENIYSDYEAKKILSDKSFPYPLSLCSGEIILSINEFTKHLKKGCSSQDIEFDLKDFNIVLLNELSSSRVKTDRDSLKIRLIKAKSFIKDTSSEQFECVQSENSLDKFMSISLEDQSLKVCHEILQVINFYRQAHLQCK